MNSNNFLKAVMIIIAAFFMSCSGDKTTLEDMSELNKQRDSLTVEIAEDVNIVYTDSAMLRAKINAPVMKRYPDEEKPRLE
ncbi:MAG: hypothetical protein ACPGYY_11005, partial [Bacteroidia bacterium]